MDCCDEARMDAAFNPRHLWSEAEREALAAEEMKRTGAETR